MVYIKLSNTGKEIKCFQNNFNHDQAFQFELLMRHLNKVLSVRRLTDLSVTPDHLYRHRTTDSKLKKQPLPTKANSVG